MSEVLVTPAGTIYGTYAAAVIYIDGQFGDAYRAWEALDVADRKRALLGATRYLDRQVWGDDYDTFAARDAIEAFQLACYELAALAAEDASVLGATDQSSNISSVGAGGASVTYFNPTSVESGSASKLPPILMQLLADYMGAADVVVVGGYSQTGDCESAFSDCEDFDRSEP